MVFGGSGHPYGICVFCEWPSPWYLVVLAIPMVFGSFVSGYPYGICVLCEWLSPWYLVVQAIPLVFASFVNGIPYGIWWFWPSLWYLLPL